MVTVREKQRYARSRGILGTTAIVLSMSAGLIAAAPAGAQIANSYPEQIEVLRWPSKAPPGVMIEAARSALQGYARGWRFAAVQPPTDLPASPARFEIVNPTAKGPLSLLSVAVTPAALSSLKSTSCKGALLDMSLYRDIDPAQSIHVFACLFQGADSYDLDIFLTDEEQPPGSRPGLGGGITRCALVASPANWEKGLVDKAASALSQVAGRAPTVVSGELYRSAPEPGTHDNAQLQLEAANRPGLELWHGASTGMRREEVLQAFEGAGIDRLALLERGLRCDLNDQSATVAGAPAEVRFCFDPKGGLGAVRVESGGDFAVLETRLNSKFGRAGVCAQGVGCTWSERGLLVQLSIAESGRPKLVYRQASTDGL